MIIIIIDNNNIFFNMFFEKKASQERQANFGGSLVLRHTPLAASFLGSGSQAPGSAAFKRSASSAAALAAATASWRLWSKDSGAILWMDQIRSHQLAIMVEPIVSWYLRWGIIIPGILGWCEMDFVHPQ